MDVVPIGRVALLERESWMARGLPCVFGIVLAVGDWRGACRRPMLSMSGPECGGAGLWPGAVGAAALAGHGCKHRPERALENQWYPAVFTALANHPGASLERAESLRCCA
jgi:hypothetical protein